MIRNTNWISLFLLSCYFTIKLLFRSQRTSLRIQNSENEIKFARILRNACYMQAITPPVFLRIFQFSRPWLNIRNVHLKFIYSSHFECYHVISAHYAHCCTDVCTFFYLFPCFQPTTYFQSFNLPTFTRREKRYNSSCIVQIVHAKRRVARSGTKVCRKRVSVINILGAMEHWRARRSSKGIFYAEPPRRGVF